VLYRAQRGGICPPGPALLLISCDCCDALINALRSASTYRPRWNTQAPITSSASVLPLLLATASFPLPPFGQPPLAYPAPPSFFYLRAAAADVKSRSSDPRPRLYREGHSPRTTQQPTTNNQQGAPNGQSPYYTYYRPRGPWGLASGSQLARRRLLALALGANEGGRQQQRTEAVGGWRLVVGSSPQPVAVQQPGQLAVAQLGVVVAAALCTGYRMAAYSLLPALRATCATGYWHSTGPRTGWAALCLGLAGPAIGSRTSS
jgi:hypothetical protein